MWIYFVLIYWIRTVFEKDEQESRWNQDKITCGWYFSHTLFHQSKQCQSFRFSSICKQTLEKYGNYVPFLLSFDSKDTNDQWKICVVASRVPNYCLPFVTLPMSFQFDRFFVSRYTFRGKKNIGINNNFDVFIVSRSFPH